MSIRIKLKIKFDFSPQDNTPIMDKLKAKSIGLSNNSPPTKETTGIDPNDSYLIFMKKNANENLDSQKTLLTMFKDMLK